MFAKLRAGKVSRSVPSRQISPLSLCKCRLTAPKIAKIGNFWYKFAPKGYISLSDFSKIWHGEGFPRFAPSRQILPFWHNKCGLTAQKIAKIANFWYTFSQRDIFP